MALHRLVDAIGEAPCRSNAQCETLPIGRKACGGPERWIAWSNASVDRTSVAAMADDYTAARRQELQQQIPKFASNCAMVTDPGAVCVAHRCVAGKAGVRLD